MAYVHNELCSSAKVLLSYDINDIEALTVKCKSPCYSKFNHIIITNVYIPPNVSQSHVTSFFDTFITSTSHLLSNNLFIVGGDFNRASTHSLSLLGLQNIVTFNTRLHSELDHFFVNCKDIFKARKLVPLSTSDHNIICAIPCIYSHTNRCEFIRSSFRTVHSRNVSPSNMSNLSTMLEQTDFSLFLWSSCR